MKTSIFKQIIFAALFQVLFAASLYSQKYENGTRLLKGAEVLSATPLQLDYVLEKLADTAKISVNIHEGKTHLVLNDGSGKWREWWYHEGRWKVKSQDIPPETDPTVPTHVKSITTANIANWNVAFGWGDHAAEGYLKNYTLPAATTSTLGGVKAGYGLSVKSDGTLDATGITNETDPTVPIHVKNISSADLTHWNTAYQWGNHNDVVSGTFTPTVSGEPQVTYHLSSNSYGKYIRNNKVVHIEIYINIEHITGTQAGQTISIEIPPELRLSKTADIKFIPAISIVNHEKILKNNYTMLGGRLENLCGCIQLIQYGENAMPPSLYVNEFKIGAILNFSVDYILL
jgi:hypothetical protein